MHSFLSALVLSFCFYDFPAGMNCKLESWAKWNLPPLSYFLSEDLITVTGMTLESPPRAPPCAPPCHSCIPELYLAFKPFARTCPSKASPPSYWLDVLGISQSGFPWLPHMVPALVPLLWLSLSSPMLIFAPAGKGLIGSAPSWVPEFGMVPGLKEEFLSSLSFLFLF